jgi:hypothetical protein
LTEQGPGIEVVPFSPEHAEGVLSLILPIQREEFGVPITAEDQPDLRDIPGFYCRADGNFWVALAGGEVVGTVGLLDIGKNRAALRKMFVREELLGLAQEQGCYKLMLLNAVGSLKVSVDTGLQAAYFTSTLINQKVYEDASRHP